MIHQFSDPALTLALARALGHPAPFSSEECQALTGPLVIWHARDLSGLDRCPNLRRLEILASELTDLAGLAPLGRLASLKLIAVPLANLDGLAACPALEELELSFSLVEEARPLLELPRLRQAVLPGNPWSEASYQQLRARLVSQAKAGAPAGLLLELSGEPEWNFTRQLRAHGLPLCFAALNGVRRVVVKPGLPSFSRGNYDFIAEPVEFLLFELQQSPDLSLAELAAMFVDEADRNDPARSIELHSRRPLAGSAAAAGWLDSALAGPARQGWRDFIRRFPGLVYYREDEAVLAELEALAGAGLPAWFRQSRQALAGVMPNQPVWVQFGPGAADIFEDRWYQLNYFGYDYDERDRFQAAGSAIRPLAIAHSPEALSTLAINLADPADPTIYEYDLESLSDSFYKTHPLSQALHPVFACLAELYGHVETLKIQNGSAVKIHAHAKNAYH